MVNVFASYGSTARDAAHPDGLTGVLDEIANNVNRESALHGVRLGVLLNAVGRRSYGPLLLMVGLFAISPATILPFMTTLVAFATLLIALQMAAGAGRPWLPKRLLEIQVPRRVLFQFLDRARPIVDRLNGVWLRPRLEFMTAPPFVFLVALCVVAAALITFPLSLVPVAPLVPGLAVVFFGLGMTARDGLWLSLGMLLVAGAVLITGPIIF